MYINIREIIEEFENEYNVYFQSEEFAIAAIDFINKSSIDDLKKVDIINLSLSDIEDIEDVKLFPNLRIIDIYDNKITDMSPLKDLVFLEGLDISYNMIEDVMELFELKNLKFVNLSGNNIPESQINALREKGIEVHYEDEE